MFKTSSADSEAWDIGMLALGIPVQTAWENVESVQSYEQVAVHNFFLRFPIYRRRLGYSLRIWVFPPKLQGYIVIKFTIAGVLNSFYSPTTTTTINLGTNKKGSFSL